MNELPAYENINNKSLNIAADRADRVINEGWQMKGDYPPIRMEGPIPWHDPEPRNRSMVFYAHSLDMLDDLLIAHSETGGERFFTPCLRIALEWIERAPAHGTPGDKSMAWYDMAVGRRAYRLAYLADVARRDPRFPAEDLAKMMASLEMHRLYLADDENIVFHNNHGFYQVAGQLGMSRRFRTELPAMQAAFEQAQVRLSRMIDIQFTGEGVHKEHSPEYHLTVYSSLQGILQAGLVEDQSIVARCQAIEQSLAWFITPQQLLVGFGDTSERLVARKAPEARRKWAEPSMQYMASRAEIGSPPAERVRGFPESGYFFATDRWPRTPEDFSDRSYLAFNAAFHSRTHKHADDQSFFWYERGQPILVDAGRYGYVDKAKEGSEVWNAGFWYADPNRMYCETTRAHNTVEIDGRDFPRRDVPPYGSALLRHGSTPSGLAFCESATTQFGNVRFERLLVLDPGRWLLVLDALASTDGSAHDFRQWFHFAPAIRVQPAAGGHVAQLAGEAGAMQISTLVGVDGQRLVVGQREPVMQGFHSPKDLVMLESAALALEALGSPQAMFATLFVLGDAPVTVGGGNALAPGLRSGQLEWTAEGGTHRIRFQRPETGAITIEYTQDEQGAPAQG